MPEATEGEHMNHPDFRVKGKIFATLFRRGDQDWGMVKLKPERQRQIIKASPEVFEPANGARGSKAAPSPVSPSSIRPPPGVRF